MSYKYLITLKPLEPFFFGGEYTFGADDSRKESSRYSAISTQLPQQTAILGMLRKTMLIQNGYMTMHKKGEWVDSKKRGQHNPNYENAKKLVGVEAFSYEKEVDLGEIETISPLFIQEKEKNYIANAKDYGLKVKELEGSISLGSGMQKALVFENFDTKKHNPFEFISNDKKLKNFSDFFKEVNQVGIKKSQDGETEDDAFFRKRSYYPKNGAVFAFCASFSTPLEWKRESIVTLGADQSSFKLTIEKNPSSDFQHMFENVHHSQLDSRIVLSSETLLSEKAYEACYFILGDRQPYRQLIDAKHGKKSKRYYLFERGSVLYTENLDVLESELNQAHLQKIGINKYITIKGTKNVQK